MAAGGRILLPSTGIGTLQPCWQRSLAHLFQLLSCRHLLGEQGGLDAVEQAFQPADQLSLGDPQFGIRGCRIFGERQHEPLQFFAQLWCESLFQFTDRGFVNVAQPRPACVVERCGAYLLQKLFDHGADTHDFRWLLDHIGQRFTRIVMIIGIVGTLLVSAGRSARFAAGRPQQRASFRSDYDNRIRWVIRLRHVSMMSFLH